MSWSINFRENADPLYFYPELNLREYQDKNLSTTPVPDLDLLIEKVVNEINTEGQRINSNFVTSLANIKVTIPNGYESLSYQEKFNTLINYGRNQLKRLRDASVNNTNFEEFYRKYYFYRPTSNEIDSIKEAFLSQDYGFGSLTQQNQKTAALNRSVEYGLLPPETSLVEFEAFVSPSNQEALVDRLLTLNGSGNKAIIDPAKVTANPTDAAYALIQLKEQNKLTINNQGKYEWTTGNDWKQLQSFNNGSLLNDYQSLIIDYDASQAQQNGLTLSQYIAQQRTDKFKEIEDAIRQKRINVDTTTVSVNQAQNIVETAVKESVEQQIQTSKLQQLENKPKVTALQLDAFKEANRVLSLQQEKEERNQEIFGTMNDMFTSISKDLGVKEGFFKTPGFQSNINFNWQNWFETEFRNRYLNTSDKNVLGKVIGEDETSARLGAQFVQDFLQKRFDASKSLSEFVSYIDPNSYNPVLQETSETAYRKLTDQGFQNLTGSIQDPSSVLGNFWTNLQGLWREGRSFDVNYYLRQSLGVINNQDLTVKQLHQNIALINEKAFEAQSINLFPEDIKELDLIGVNKDSNEELANQIELYKNWFYKAYENGADLSDASQFAKLHYDSYTKNSQDPALSIQPGVNLLINNPNLFTETEYKKINKQVKYLTEEANKYLEGIQFGVFKTPEEYLGEMIKKLGIVDTENSDLFKEAGLNDVLKDYFEQFSGTISSYAGEMIRNQIRTIIDTGKTPDQKTLGIDYIQRTKDQALSTIRSLINKDVYKNNIVIDNAPGAALNQSMNAWFLELGLSLVPGEAWNEYKGANGLAPDLDFNEWEKTEGKTIDPTTGLSKQKMFWNQWAQKNNVEIIESLDPSDRNKTRTTVVVKDPTPAWIAWAKRLSNTDANNEKLQGALINVRTDGFNTDWYSKTNPYTKIRDEWNQIASNPNRDIIDTKGKELYDWAKNNGLNPEEPWVEYRTAQQQNNSKFGKDELGNNLSYITWSQTANKSDIDEFWKNSNGFWFNYLTDKGVIKGGSESRPVFKTWNEWSVENQVALNRVSTQGTDNPPSRFLELHYYALGGSDKVNDEYIKTYFPEFSELENNNLLSKGALKDTPFDLSSFGFDKEEAEISTPFSISKNKTFQSPIDFALQQIFGDTNDWNETDDFPTITQKSITNFNLNLDTSYNKTKNKNLSLMDFGFGDFGGSSFGF